MDLSKHLGDGTFILIRQSKDMDFEQNMDDPYKYIRVDGKSVIYLKLYVDDVLIIGNDIGSTFHGKSLVVVSY